MESDSVVTESGLLRFFESYRKGTGSDVRQELCRRSLEEFYF